MWDVVGDSEKMETQKDINDQNEARALCSTLQQHLESCCPISESLSERWQISTSPSRGELGVIS